MASLRQIICISFVLLFLDMSVLAQVNASNTDAKATIYIYQTPHARMLKRAAPPVFCDDRLLAELDGGRYFVVKLDAGTYSFHSKNKKNGGVEFEVKSGETYYLRVEMKHTGYFLKFSGISLIPKEQGAYSVKQLRPINAKDVKDASRVDMNFTEQVLEKKSEVAEKEIQLKGGWEFPFPTRLFLINQAWKSYQEIWLLIGA